MRSFTTFVVLALSLGAFSLPMPQAQAPGQQNQVPATLKTIPAKAKLGDNTKVPPNGDGTPGVCPAGPGELSVKANQARELPVSFQRRAGEEFIGYLGTTKLNGDLLLKVSAEKGSLESLTLNGDGFNIGDDGPGLDGDFGLGLSIRDDFLAAEARAENVAKDRKKQEGFKDCALPAGDDVPVVCLVEAKSGDAFRANKDKLWVLSNVISSFAFGGVDPERLLKQDAFITDAGVDPKKALRFHASIREDELVPTGSNKALIPEAAFADFVVSKCLPVGDGAEDASAGKFGTPTFPEFNYRDKAADFKISGEPF